MSDERRPDEPEVPEEEAAGSVGDAVAESDGSVQGGQDPAGSSDPVGSQDPVDSPEIAPADFDAGPGATVPIVPRQLPTAASFFGEPRAPRHSAHVEPGPPSSGPVAPEAEGVPGASVAPATPVAPGTPVAPEAVAPTPATPTPATPAAPQEVVAAPEAPPEPEPEPESASEPAHEGTAFAQPAWPSEPEPTTAPAAPHPMALDLSALRGQHDDSDDAVEPPAPWSLTGEQPSLDATAFPAHDGEGEVPTAAFGAVFGSTPTAPVQHVQPESSFTELLSMPADAVPDSSEPASFNWADLPAPATEPPVTQAFHFEDAHAVPPIVAPPADVPSSAAVVNEQPIPEASRAEEPLAEEPRAEEPRAEEPRIEEPRSEEPRADEPDAATAMFPAQGPAGDASEPQDLAAEPVAEPNEPVAEPADPAAADAETPLTPAPWWLGERLAEAAAERKSAVAEPQPQDAPTSDEPPTFTELLGVVPAEPTHGDESEAPDGSSAAESAGAAPVPEPAPGTPWSLTSDIEPQVPRDASGETPSALGAAAIGPDDDVVAPPIEPFWRQPVSDESPAEPVVPAPAAATSEPDPDVDPVAALFGDIVEPTEPGEIVEEHRLAGSEWPAVEVDSDWADVPRDPALESDAAGADLPPTEAFTLPEADEADEADQADVVPPAEETPTQAMPEAESAWAAAAAAAAAEAAAQEARASQAAAARQVAQEQLARAEAARAEAARADAARAEFARSEAARAETARAETARAETARAEAARAEAERAATERIAAAPTPPPASAPGAPTPSGVGASRRPVTPIDPTKVPASWTTAASAAPAAAPARTGGTGAGDGFSAWPRQRKIVLFVGIIVAFVVVLLALFFFSYSIASNAASAPAHVPVATASQQTSAAPKPTPTTTPSPTSSTGTVSAGVHQWSDLRGGECLSSFTNAWQQTYTVVSCNNAHAGQLIATGSVAGAAGSAYPGLSALQAQVAPKCQANTVLNISAAQAYTGVQVSASYPATAAEWAAGSRTYFCFVSRTGGQTFTSSLAAAG